MYRTDGRDFYTLAEAIAWAKKMKREFDFEYVSVYKMSTEYNEKYGGYSQETIEVYRV